MSNANGPADVPVPQYLALEASLDLLANGQPRKPGETLAAQVWAQIRQREDGASPRPGPRPVPPKPPAQVAAEWVTGANLLL